MRVLVYLVLVVFLTLRSATPSVAAYAEPTETVVLLHGVAMPALVMHRVARGLRADGYRTINLSYPSRTMPIEQIARDYLPAQLRAHGVDSATRLHFVTHSMGSLVLRLYLRDHRLANLGRIVMVAPPNHGSTAADGAVQQSALRWLLGINLARLGTGDAGIARTLGPTTFEVGIIAGNTAINPLFKRRLAGPNDGAVTVESAKLEGMRDFIVLPHSHTLLLWRADTITQVLAFLRHGHFARANPPKPVSAELASLPGEAE